MPWPDIDYIDLPNGRTITVCAPHKMVTCGKCCLDFSFDLSDDDNDAFLDREIDSDDDRLFGYNLNSPVPRDVSAAQVAASRYGRPAPSASRRSNATNNKIVDDDESDNSMPPLVDDPMAPIHGQDFFYSALPPEKTQHSGTVFPSKFGQQGRTPLSPGELFPATRGTRTIPSATRFINRHDKSQCLIYTDGACSDNGAADARGGCAFVFKPSEPNGQSGIVSFKLEDRGPDGEEYRHTSNRAELRAVVAALRFRAWDGEGFKSVVIATDSSYVVDGATEWARAWIKKGWRVSAGDHVKNRDLWEALLLDVEKLHDRGCSVRFWRIPRQHNSLADKEAKRAASNMKSTDKFHDINGILV
ncbi:ribonuclease H-like protein [Colletotrichum zoysiae]|uniref:ribonuclease H n=1 Tax=Colletotrichum zoysiae TaxID=1216348 RepID=A0AAD9HCX2_9PEZI|nr:ribonuclease H-like protein [Colletotrichum zoysiae]